MADGFVVGDFPVAADELLRLLVDVDRRFVTRQEEEAAGDLLQVVRRVRIQQRARLEQVQSLLNVALLTLDHSCREKSREESREESRLELS